MCFAANLATEIGFYQGYTTAWLTLLEKQDQVKRDVSLVRKITSSSLSLPLKSASCFSK
jgi:hypothetical protein